MTINSIQIAANNSNFDKVNTLDITPSSVASEGNLLVLIISNRDTVGTITWPSGFTERNSQLKSGVAIKIAGSSEPTSYTVSWSGGADTAAIGFLEYSGIDSSDLIDVEASNSGSGTSLSSGTTAATDASAERALAIFCGDNASQFISPTYTNGFSQTLSSRRGDFLVGFIYVAERADVPASTTLETTATATSGSGSAMWAYIVSFHNGPLTAGAPTVTDRTSTTASLSSPAGSGGVGPYTYQWHRSTTSGFTPDVGTEVSGATSLTLEDTGLTDGVTYYYVIVVTDNDATEVESAEVSVTTSGSPSVVITDDEGNTNGIVSIEGPAFVSFYITESLKGGGEWVNSKVEWDFGDPGTRGNQIRGFSAGHLYEIEPDVATDFTVTCTITNQNGLSASNTRTVRVTPNTRRIVYVDPDIGSASPTDPTDPGDPYDTITNLVGSETEIDLDIRMAAGKTHVWGATVGGSNKDNIIVRSTVAGTKWNCVASVDVILAGGSRNGMKDAYFPVSGFGTYCLMLDPRGIGGFRCWLKDCDSIDPDVATVITAAGTISTGIIDCSTEHDINGDIFYAGDLLTVIGHSSTYTGVERPFRGNGDWATFFECVGHYNGTSSKTCFTRHGGNWLWVDKCEFYIDAGAVVSGWAVQIGHTAAAYNPGVHYAVVERSLMQVSSDLVGGTFYPILVGATEQEVEDVCVRNCLLLGRYPYISAAHASYPVKRVSFFHNTITSDVNRWFQMGDEQSDNTFKNNLGIGSSTGAFVAIIDRSTTSNPLIENNVWPVDDDGTDIKVDSDPAETWAAFNTRGIGTGNLSAVVSINENFRPTDTDDVNVLVPNLSEMGAVSEDYYGNPRTGEAWIAGAVGEIPPTPPTPTVSTESVSAGTIEFTAIVSYVDGTDDNYTSIFSKDGSFVEFGASIPDLIDRISRDASVRSFLNAIGVSTTVKPQNSDVNGVSWRFQVKSESGKTMAAWSETHVDDYYFLSEYGVGYWGFLATDGGVSALFDRLV